MRIQRPDIEAGSATAQAIGNIAEKGHVLGNLVSHPLACGRQRCRGLSNAIRALLKLLDDGRRAGPVEELVIAPRDDAAADRRRRVVEHAEHLEKILAVRDQLPHLRAVVMMDGDSPDPGVHTWQELIELGASVPEAEIETRIAAQRLHVFTRFTYTLETIIQAGHRNLWVVDVPVRVNDPTRPSRLIRSVPAYLGRSVVDILRTYLIYRPTPIFGAMYKNDEATQVKGGYTFKYGGQQYLVASSLGTT